MTNTPELPTVTGLESSLIFAMVNDDYAAGDPHAGTWVWSALESAGLEGQRGGGVLTSLQDKGLAWVTTERNPDDNACGLTDLGRRVLEELAHRNELEEPARRDEEPDERPTPDLDRVAEAAGLERALLSIDPWGEVFYDGVPLWRALAYRAQGAGGAR